MFKAPGLGAPRRRAARCAHALPPQACPPAPRRRLSGPHAVVPLPLAIGIALRQLAPVQSYRSIQHKDGDYKHQRTAHCPALRRGSTLESRLTLLRRSAVRSFIVHASTQSSGSQSSTYVISLACRSEGVVHVVLAGGFRVSVAPLARACAWRGDVGRTRRPVLVHVCREPAEDRFVRTALRTNSGKNGSCPSVRLYVYCTQRGVSTD